MLKLHAQLENVLKVRINSNSEIILGLKKLAEAGKMDKPKELAMFAIILDRLGKLEDEALIEESLKNDDINEIGGNTTTGILSGSPEDWKRDDSTDNFIPEPLKVEESTTQDPPTANVEGKEGEVELKLAETEATTPPDAPQQPETPELVQTPVETTPEETSTETSVNDETDDGNDTGTISEFTPENIAAQPVDPETPPTT